MTGTFDNWTKSEKLEKVGSGFAKNVQLPSKDKVLYKVRRSVMLEARAKSKRLQEGDTQPFLQRSDVACALRRMLHRDRHG